MQLLRRRLSGAVTAALLAVAYYCPIDAQSGTHSSIKDRLEQGEVVVGLKSEGEHKFVTGSVIINEPPESVWPIMVNPFEFPGKIEPRMKNVEVVVDKTNLSVLKVTLDMSFLFPNFNYVVESTYEAGQRIDFHRVGGTLRDFRGSWEMHAIDGGNKTELTYSMYIDPGFYVPQWIVREGVRGELPRTLKALRKRVEAVCASNELAESHTILAASTIKSTPAASEDRWR